MGVVALVNGPREVLLALVVTGMLELVLGGTVVMLLDGVDVTMIVVLLLELVGGLELEVVITGTELIDEEMLETILSLDITELLEIDDDEEGWNPAGTLWL